LEVVLGGRNFNITLLRANGSVCDVALSRNSKTFLFFSLFIFVIHSVKMYVVINLFFLIAKYTEIVNVYVFKTSRLFGFSYK
jgi:hypothetical protein